MMTDALAPITTTYRQLGDTLVRLGFRVRVMPQFTAYRNAPFDALLVLPQETPDDPVRPLHLAAARATVVGKGVAPADEFDRLLRTVAAVPSSPATVRTKRGVPGEKTAGAKKRAKKSAAVSAFAASAVNNS